MPDPAINEFFQERKAAWLKSKIKSSMGEDEIKTLEQECDEKFSLADWLPDAAKRAGQINISTHPCTFSHPSARKNKNGYVSSIIAKANREPDGYLRTGNVSVAADALGNAAALDVHKFLHLVMADGKALIEHISERSELAESLLSIETEQRDNLEKGFLAMITSDSEKVTSSKIKQVYFPLDDGEYHQLSVLTNSGLVFEQRKRIDDIRFSDATKAARECKKNNEWSDSGFREIYSLTTIGYGGTKPQNISVLNNQNAGKAHLFSSTPPLLEKRDIHFPKQEFFRESLRYWAIDAPLKKLHGIFRAGLDSPIPRRNLQSGRDKHIDDILDVVIEKSWQVRSVFNEQFYEASCQLSSAQQIWLREDKECLAKRYTEQAWLDDIGSLVSQWIQAAYKKQIKKPVQLGPEEISYIESMIEQRKEALR